MARKRNNDRKTEVADYRHEDERLNNPPAGLAAEVEAPAAAGAPRRRYSYNPHLDPRLMFDSQEVRERAERLLAEIAAADSLEVAQAKARELERMQEPWLQWAGKAEHTSFEVDSVPLYIHERISTQAILRAVKREEVQKSLFGDPEMPLHEAVEAYRHPMDWANRLVLGDSLVVMNSLLERERMAGQVQMIYIDPPYGIGYNSNFQARVDKRDVKDGADDDLTREPEQIRAYRDTWTLGIHSYLTYLRDRLLLAKELLSETGSVFVQINDENLHHVREVLDDVFGPGNFAAIIGFVTTSGFETTGLTRAGDYVLWYYRDASRPPKVHTLFEEMRKEPGDGGYRWLVLPDGSSRGMTAAEARGREPIPDGSLLYKPDNILSQGSASQDQAFAYRGKTYRPRPNNHWKASHPDGMNRLASGGRLHVAENTIQYVRAADDFPLKVRTTLWLDTVTGQFTDEKLYAVQTNPKVIARCLLMTTDPGDLVLDPTCGSGTTAFVAEQWGRRWITCDTSRVAVFLARQRLLTAKFDYYDLADEARGVTGGFRYKTVPHITLKSIANNPDLDPDKVAARREAIAREHPQASEQEVDRLLREANEEIIRANADQETLYDQPEVVRNKVRVSGPFTVEAIPPPSLEAMEETPIGGEPEVEADGGGRQEAQQDGGGVQAPALQTAATSPTEHVETLIEQLRKDGVLFPDNKQMVFASLTGCGSGVIHAEGEPTNGGAGGLKRVAISFGPLYGPVTGHQVEDGLREARMGGYDGIIFAGFAFDAEAQANVDHYRDNPQVKAFIAHIRPDMLMTDEDGRSLLKTTASSQLFTVFGEPEVKLGKTRQGHVVELLGVDVYDPVTGAVSSARGDRVAAWFIDTDYDGRTFCICQAFFPDKSAWDKLGRALKSAVDPEKFEMLSGTKSVAFKAGKHNRVAVKVIDRRGNEVMVVRPL